MTSTVPTPVGCQDTLGWYRVGPVPPDQTSTGYGPSRDAYRARLRRIEGQVRGLQRMVGEDAYCIDVLTQIAAATKALQGVAPELLEEHMRHCLVEAAAAGGPEADAKVIEAKAAIERLLKARGVT
jgi:DNA-binding FrmR family transcriptional regulator